MFALGLGLLLSAIGTFKSDFLFAGQFILQAGVYLSPIIYPLESVPDRWYSLYILNPMVGLLEAFRSVLAYGRTPDLDLLAHSMPGIILTWLIAWPLFRIMSRYFADVL
jgi:lipopolysaccharide transport system permease protein